MKNLTPKKQKIAQAYGNYADIALEICDENGWIYSHEYYSYFPRAYEKRGLPISDMFRPSVLRGLESNNGWIRIESDGSNLPQDRNKHYHYCINGQAVFHNGLSTINGQILCNRFFEQNCGSLKITHYREAIFLPDPIY